MDPIWGADQWRADAHNEWARVRGQVTVNADNFFRNLRADGAINDAALTTLSWEDIREHGVKPRTLAKAIADIFRAKAAPESAPKGGSDREDDERVITAKKAERMTPRALLKAYDPAQKESAVADRLRYLSDDRPFLVFGDDFKVNVDASLTLLEELQDGEEPRDVYAIEGEEPRPVCRVGDNPAVSDLVDECPIHPGEPLRKGGLCRQTNRSWESVSQTVRELLRLAIETGELRVASVDDAHDTMDRATQDNAEGTLRSRYQRASVRHGQFKKNDQLPRLKVRKGTGVAQQQPPFGGSSRTGNTGAGSTTQPLATSVLYDALVRLLPAQFEEVLFRLSVPTHHMPPATASQSDRAIALCRLMETAQRTGELRATIERYVRLPAANVPAGIPRVVRLRPGTKDDGPTMANLRRVLKGVVTSTAKLEQIRDEVGLAGRVDVSGAADNAWFRLLDEAKKHGAAKIEQILGIVLGEYPDAEAVITPFLLNDAPRPPAHNPSWSRERISAFRTLMVKNYGISTIPAGDAGIDLSGCTTRGSANEVWESILAEAGRSGHLDALLKIAMDSPYAWQFKQNGF